MKTEPTEEMREKIERLFEFTDEDIHQIEKLQLAKKYFVAGYNEAMRWRDPIIGGMLRCINALRQTDRYIEMIYMNGACYQFHLLLKTFFPESKPYISKEKDHVITKYAGRYYDITGEVSGNWYTPMTESEIDMASGWSFHRTKVIQIGECPHCEEPIVV